MRVSRALVRGIVIDAKAVRYTRFGTPSSVLKLETVRLDSSILKPTDVLVQMLAAPITLVDLAQIAGSASYPSSLPSAGSRVCGSEGVGVVVEASPSSGLKKGDVVAPSIGGLGTWATHVIAPAASWARVGSDAGSLGALESVAAGIAPTLAAQRLLSDFVQLQKGDVVVLNDGANLVSQAVVQLAARRGIRTVSLIRPGTGPAFEALAPHLSALGASLVVSEAEAATHLFKKTLADFKGAALGLNASGGEAALTVARCLAPRGVLVTYGTSARRTPALTAPLDIFTASELTLKGFSLPAWAARTDKGARDVEVAAAAKEVSGAAPGVRVLVAREPFADFAAALKRATAPGCERPVVLTF